jgi:hypothetical protein
MDTAHHAMQEILDTICPPDDFRAQVAEIANMNKKNGAAELRNEVLRWAAVHRSELEQAGLLHSLLRMLGQ